MDIVDKYFAARQSIYDECGYIETWRDCPLDDMREYIWWVDQSRRREIIWGPDEAAVLYGLSYEGYLEDSAHRTIKDPDPEWYSCSIYVPGNTTREDRGVFRGSNWVLVRADTQTDGNKQLFVFDVAKEYKIPPEPPPPPPKLPTREQRYNKVRHQLLHAGYSREDAEKWVLENREWDTKIDALICPQCNHHPMSRSVDERQSGATSFACVWCNYSCPSCKYRVDRAEEKESAC